MNTFTTPDRRTRDSELTALAGIHTAVRRRWQQLEDDVSAVSSNASPISVVSHGSSRLLRVRSDQSRSSSEVDGAEGDFSRRWEEEEQMLREGTGWSEEMEIRDGSVVDQEDGWPGYVRRDQVHRIQGRQSRLQLVRWIVEGRQRELHSLSEHRSVSQFPHRARIQSLLRGRFLRNGVPIDEDRPPSLATRELCQLRQRHRVSGLREGFRFRLENIVRDQVTHHSDTSAGLRDRHTNNSNNAQSELTIELDLPSENHHHSQTSIENFGINQVSETRIERLHVASNDDTTLPELQGHRDDSRVMSEWHQGSGSTYSEWQGESFEQESDVNMEESYHDWSNETPEIDVVEDNEEDWHADSSVVTGVEAWQDEHFATMTSEEFFPMRRVNRFIMPPDDQSVYSMELRELLNRRSVSNLLSSEFRESLDQLIQSYVQRQGQSPIDWDVQESRQNPLVQTEDHNQQGDIPNINQPNSVHQLPVAPPLAIPPQPPPPNFHQERHHHWTRYMTQRSEGNNVVNDLRTEMARLQQGMSHMQRTLETFMDMQVEMQRSLRQELSAALGLSLDEQGSDVCMSSSRDGSKWNHVRKGMCFVCCVGYIDSLLYRCGHMCTCLKCAYELVETGKKCPLCRAPIVEVIRTYSIL